MAESISEGTLKSWLKQPGDFVNADEEVATIETDKVRIAHFLRTPYAPRPSSKKIGSLVIFPPILDELCTRQHLFMRVFMTHFSASSIVLVRRRRADTLLRSTFP